MADTNLLVEIFLGIWNENQWRHPIYLEIVQEVESKPRRMLSDLYPTEAISNDIDTIYDNS